MDRIPALNGSLGVLGIDSFAKIALIDGVN